MGRSRYSLVPPAGESATPLQVGKPASQAQKAGLGQAAAALGIPLADFENGREITFAGSPFIKKFNFANGALDADIQGAQLAGLHNVWLTAYADRPSNRARRAEIMPEAEIDELAQLPAVLEAM